MRSGKELILATKLYAKEQRAKSWLCTLSTLALLLALLAIIFWVPNLFIKICSSILLGLISVRMFVIYHDYMHHTILQKSVLANWIMTAFGVYILAPPSIWKRSHDYHHNHNSKLFSANFGSYPIATKTKFESMNRKERRAYLAIRHPLTIALSYLTLFYYGMCIGSFLSCPRRHADSLLAIVLHLIYSLAVILFVGFEFWIYAIIIPFSLACAIGGYLFYAQHNFPGVEFKANADWTYDNAALKSSSYMKMNKVMAWFTGNIGYHHIHHLNARIPFYRLPEVMKAFPELQDATITTLSLKDIYRCFKLKVWDTETNHMTGYVRNKIHITIPAID